jgi:inosose dehydratase
VRDTRDRIAAAPITWGVCEVKDWGHQLPPERVLQEVSELGLHAIELGPPGFLPADPPLLRARLDSYRLGLIGGFVPVVLHVAARLEQELAEVAAVADLLASASAEVLIIAADSAPTGYEQSERLDSRALRALADGIERVEELGMDRGLQVVLHPHYGTAVASSRDIERVLESSPVALCLDTGHLSVAGADASEVAKSFSERIAHVHLKDVDSELAELVRSGVLGYQEAVARGMYRPLGSGDVDFESVLAPLQGSRYGGWLVLEQDLILREEPPKGGGPIIDARAGIDYLRGMIANDEKERQYERRVVP